jgi:hypothetical protein
VIIEQMGLKPIRVDFNDLAALSETVAQHRPMLRWCSIRASALKIAISWQRCSVLNEQHVPTLTDDNYAVMKVANIGCECGATLATFSCFKLFGPEGVGRWVVLMPLPASAPACIPAAARFRAQALEVLRGWCSPQ